MGGVHWKDSRYAKLFVDLMHALHRLHLLAIVCSFTGCLFPFPWLYAMHYPSCLLLESDRQKRGAEGEEKRKGKKLTEVISARKRALEMA